METNPCPLVYDAFALPLVSQGFNDRYSQPEKRIWALARLLRLTYQRVRQFQLFSTADRKQNPLPHKRNLFMLGLTITFLLIAILAGVLGFTGIAGASASIAQICFVVFVVLFLISLISGVVRRAIA